VRFYISTSLNIGFSYFYEVSPCGLVDRFQCLRKTLLAVKRKNLEISREEESEIWNLSRTKWGHAVYHVIYSWTLSAKALVHSRATPCGVCGGQSGTE
jgi:hypothetical protein